MENLIPSQYSPKETEEEIYRIWEHSGFFDPDNLPGEKRNPYSIVLPPPNVTGTLHMGHALMLAIEDIMIRFERMRGKRTLWLPGTDHAAIATQSKVESIILKEEGLTRHDLGREEFLKRVETFAKESHDTIVSQMKKMGASVDWSREAYTLDEKRNLAVRTAFKTMYDAGLIYKGRRTVNWDPKLQTTVSDDEVERIEERTPLYYLKYGPFTIATARPETKFGDKFVVLHPDDPRYKKYEHGEKLDVEWINGRVTATIIKDPVIDMEFGTGAMTITPWHDMTDFDIAERHKLAFEQIIDFTGKLMPIAGEFAGLNIKKARPLIVEKLKEKGLLEKIDAAYSHRIATNSRGGGVIEPQIKEQWFVGVNSKFEIRNSKLKSIKNGQEVTLKELMRSAVESGEIKIIPERFEKIYYHWIDNLRDWCISRQIWYGHRIPVWYKRALGGPHQAKHFDENIFLNKLGMTREEFQANTDGWQELPDYAQSGGSPNIQIGISLLTILKDRNLLDDHWINQNQISKPVYRAEEMHVGIEPPEGIGWEQDPDTLDTWFSSGLWTFSTLGWPEETTDLKTYHPTNVLETGYDILFFWVARMILMSTYLLGEVPFRTVYLHGLIRDAEKKKMSKSKGNIVDPLDLGEKYGTDALRFGLIFGTAPGTDIPLSEDKIRGMKYFSNKLWNVARFVLTNIDSIDFEKTYKDLFAKTDADKDIIKKLNAAVLETSNNLERYNIHEAAQVLYSFAWHEFADNYIEASKPQLANPELAVNTKAILGVTLATIIKLLHPFMPFITEKIWSLLPGHPKNLLMIEPWPSQDSST